MGAEGDSVDAGDSGAATGTAVTVHIRCSNGSKVSVQTSLNATVGAFKAVVAGSCDIPAERQRLIYKGRILKDDQTLESYGTPSIRCPSPRRCFFDRVFGFDYDLYKFDCIGISLYHMHFCCGDCCCCVSVVGVRFWIS